MTKHALNLWLKWSNNLHLKTSNDLEFIIVESKLNQASIVYGKNKFLKLSVLQ